MSALPDIPEVREWCGVSVAACSDALLADVMAAEAENQRKACRIADPLDRPADLCQAFLRRVARSLAARGVPLGLTSGEQGQLRLTTFDGEIERLEGWDRGFWFA